MVTLLTLYSLKSEHEFFLLNGVIPKMSRCRYIIKDQTGRRKSTPKFSSQRLLKSLKIKHNDGNIYLKITHKV